MVFPPRRVWVDSSRGLARGVFWPTPGKDPYEIAPRQGCGEYLHTDLSGTPAGVHSFLTPTGGTGQNSRPVPPAIIHPHPPGWDDRATKKTPYGKTKSKNSVTEDTEGAENPSPAKPEPKKKTNSHSSRGERGDAEEQPNSHSLTETRRHGEKRPSQNTQQPIARGGTAKTKSRFFVFPPCPPYLCERMAVGNFFLP